jgi:hypothetical protein
VRGGEHCVTFNPVRQRVLKSTRPDLNHGFGITEGRDPSATPSEYLDRLLTQNRIFSDDVQLEWIALVAQGISIVTSQPFIEGRDATQDEIESFMARKGFKKVGQGAFYHTGEDLLIHDLMSRNVKVDPLGRIHPIDAAITRVAPEFVKNRYRI